MSSFQTLIGLLIVHVGSIVHGLEKYSTHEIMFGEIWLREY